MSRRLEWDNLNRLLESESIDKLSVEQIADLFHGERMLTQSMPDSTCQVDPRDGELIVYNASRALRPNIQSGVDVPIVPENDGPCVICEGRTTGILDVAPLSDGFTFINKNLYPIVYPLRSVRPEYLELPLCPDPQHQGRVAHGFHFLQWTSSLHDKDFHNMPIDDCVVVLQRLAALESRLLYGSRDIMPPSDLRDSKRTRGFVSVIKNYGRFSGGSLAHGHQQIGFSNMMPRRIYNNRSFLHKRGETFSAFLQRENSPDLIVKDYGPAMLVVPYFMRRPYHLMLVLKDFSKQYVHELDMSELRAVANGLQDGILALVQMIARLGRVPSYSITTSNGPGAGLYFEFHPYTQETGGFEHIGLWICQESPLCAAERLRTILNGDEIPESTPQGCGPIRRPPVVGQFRS